MSDFRLLYHSNSDLTGSDLTVRATVFAIAEAAGERNLRVGVTGALMFMSGVFVQLLEGRGDAVEAVFERICRDLRHRRLVLLDFSQVEKRAFPGSGMVAFEGDERARRLFPPVSEAPSFTRGNRLSANMAVEMMMTLHRERAALPHRKATDWMIATDVVA